MSEPATMMFLSFSRPWLWAILHTDPAIRKLIENRTWSPPQSMIGKRFALHAAKSMDENAFRYFNELGITDYPARYDLYPAGTLVGVATIDRVRTGDRDHIPNDIAPEQRKWFFGPFGWVLSDVVALDSHIPMKGGQGLRYLSDEIDLQVKAQLAEIARRPIVRYLTPEESEAKNLELHRLARLAGKI